MVGETHPVQKFVQETIECYELVREYAVTKKGRRTVGDPEMQSRVLEFIPHAAANGYLFSAEQCGKVIAMAIAGPTNKPTSLHGYHPGGKMLCAYYALVHPRWRFMQKGIVCLQQMLFVALSRFPYCEVMCYFRHGGSAYKEMPLSDDLRGVKWAAREKRRSGTVETGLSKS